MGARTDVAAWREANVIPVMQPGFLYNFIGDFVPLLLGTPRLRAFDARHDGLARDGNDEVRVGGE